MNLTPHPPLIECLRQLVLRLGEEQLPTLALQVWSLPQVLRTMNVATTLMSGVQHHDPVILAGSIYKVSRWNLIFFTPSFKRMCSELE